MGLTVLQNTNYLLSISDDSKLKVIIPKTKQILTEISPRKSAMKSLLYLKEREVAIIGDGEGYIHIYNTSHVIFILD